MQEEVEVAEEEPPLNNHRRPPRWSAMLSLAGGGMNTKDTFRDGWCFRKMITRWGKAWGDSRAGERGARGVNSRFRGGLVMLLHWWSWWRWWLRWWCWAWSYGNVPAKVGEPWGKSGRLLSSEYWSWSTHSINQFDPRRNLIFSNCEV